MIQKRKIMTISMLLFCICYMGFAQLSNNDSNLNDLHVVKENASAKVYDNSNQILSESGNKELSVKTKDNEIESPVNEGLLMVSGLLLLGLIFVIYKWKNKIKQSKELLEHISKLQLNTRELQSKLEEVQEELVEANEKIVMKEPELKEVPLPSLLDNKPFVKLTTETVDIIKKLENYNERLQDNEAALMISEQTIADCKDALVRSGVERISDSSIFNTLLHEPVPMQLIKEETEIEKVISTGLKIENRVFLKSKIEIKNKM